MAHGDIARTSRPRARREINHVPAARAGLTALAMGIYRYSAWLSGMSARLAVHSRIAATPFGPLEYAEAGEGPAVLLAHGILGGWDQGMLVTELAGPGERPFRILAVSRWGYLRTPIPAAAEQRTHEAQADAYAALLDYLQIESAAMVGISGGGPSAIQFALRHPHRCWALISVSGVTRALDPRLTRRQQALLRVLNNDLGLLLLRKLAQDRVLALYGTSTAALDALAAQPEKRRVLEAVYFPHPLFMRRAGFALDLKGFPAIPRYPVERISAPTLAIHGTLDHTVPLSHARFLAERVPGADLLAIEGGSHMAVVTHKEIALSAALHFLRTHAPDATSTAFGS